MPTWLEHSHPHPSHVAQLFPVIPTVTTAVGGCNFQLQILEKKDRPSSRLDLLGHFHLSGTNIDGGGKKADPQSERHFSETREESLTCVCVCGSASRSTEKPGDLSAALAWVASNNTPTV